MAAKERDIVQTFADPRKMAMVTRRRQALGIFGGNNTEKLDPPVEMIKRWKIDYLCMDLRPS